MKKSWLKTIGLTLLFILVYVVAMLLSPLLRSAYEALGGVMSKPRYMQFSLFGEIISIGVMILFCRYALKLRSPDLWLSPQGKTISYGKGYLVGILLFSSYMLISLLLKTLVYSGVGQLPLLDGLLYLPAFAVQSFQEELLSRGLLQRLIKDRWGITASILLPSIFFAALHLRNTGISFIALLNIFLVGVLFSLMVYATGSLWYAAAAHAAWNYVQGVLFGQYVSGIELGGSLFRFDVLGKKDLLTGGRFGPEGSALVSVILGVGILYYSYTFRKKVEKEKKMQIDV